jgi:hypothetical protein
MASINRAPASGKAGEYVYDLGIFRWIARAWSCRKHLAGASAGSQILRRLVSWASAVTYRLHHQGKEVTARKSQSQAAVSVTGYCVDQKGGGVGAGAVINIGFHKNRIRRGAGPFQLTYGNSAAGSV